MLFLEQTQASDVAYSLLYAKAVWRPYGYASKAEFHSMKVAKYLFAKLLLIAFTSNVTITETVSRKRVVNTTVM